MIKLRPLTFHWNFGGNPTETCFSSVGTMNSRLLTCDREVNAKRGSLAVKGSRDRESEP